MPLEKTRSLIEQDLALTNQIISEQLGSDIPLIREICQHIFASGGKQIRPILVLLCTKAFAYTGQEHLVLAAVIELIHTATLLHDDVVDASDMRRSRETANKIWGNAASVLVGDYLYSRSFQLVIQVNSMPIIALLARAANTISRGEVLQLSKRNDLTLTEDMYMEIIRSKTAALFETATQLGAVLCNRRPEEIQAMARYGQHLGIAFQITDDALDYGASSQDIGKRIGQDLSEGKMTLPLIYALRNGTPEQVNTMLAAMNQANLGDDEVKVICQTIEATKALEYTYQVAQQHVDYALQNLPLIPDSVYRDTLADVARFAVARGY